MQKMNISNLRELQLENVKMDFFGCFSIYLNFDKFGAKVEEIVKNNIAKYLEEFPNIDLDNECEYGFILEWDKNLFHNIREFKVIFCINQKSDEGDETYRYYEDIRVDLTEEDVSNVKNIVLDKMREVLFEN